MNKADIAEKLDEIGKILEIKGENPFKVRAYANGARALEMLAGNLAELINEGKLTEVKGIGVNLAAHIEELLQTGKCEEFEALRASVPVGVLQLMNIQGLGAKKVAVLWKELNVTSFDELEKACHEGRVAELSGFGKKTEDKIIESIAHYKQFASRHLYPVAFEAAREIMLGLDGSSVIIRCGLAGSLRRNCETVKDIDIVASSNRPNQVMDYFVTLPQVEHVINKGTTKSSVQLKCGMAVDLRVVDDEEFPFALHHFTGSKDHNVALRSLAKKKNLKINEYGLFEGPEEKFIPCQDETELFAKFELPYIPAELREGLGEIKAAQENNLPELVTIQDLIGVVHNHTTYSDGKNSLVEMTLAAKMLGYRYIAITDHSQSSAGFVGGLLPDQIKKQHDEIDRLNQEMDGIRIIKGIEVEIHRNGQLDYDDKIMEQFELVIAEVQPKGEMTELEMTERICTALSNPFVDILAHPTGRQLLKRPSYPVNMLEIIDCAAETGVAIEINANPNRLEVDWRLGPYMKAKKVKTIISPDAHRIDQLENVMFGVNMARKAWFEKEDVLNCLNAEELLAHFAEMRKKRL